MKKYKSIFISDIHLGTGICQYEKLLDFLKSLENLDKNSYEIENLFLVGDILDLIKMNHFIFWSKHRTVVKKLLRMADKGVNIYYIPGNHDYFIRKEIENMEKNFNGIIFSDKIIYESNNKKYLIIHGDQFDGAIRSMPILYIVGSSAYGLTLLFNKIYNYYRKIRGLDNWSLSLWLKTKVKNAVKYINNYEKLICNMAKEEKVHGVICGHIHKAEISKIEDIEYYNCGCWTEYCSAIVEHTDGKMELIYL
jgi:UDP-2,3-diacylglucosamine pyrophosphatase LpxH